MQKAIKITKYWRIKRIIEELPDSIEILLENDLDCIGCSGASTERLYEGLKSHDFSDEKIQKIVDDLNLLAQKEFNKNTQDSKKDLESKAITKTKEGFKIGELQIANQALEFIAQFIEQSQVFSINLVTSGCSGYEYKLEIEDQAKDDQVVFLVDSINIAINAYTYQKSLGASLYFQKSLTNSGLKIKNPNQKSHCSCGKSISL